MGRIETLRRIVERHQYEEIEGFEMDVMTASAMVAVHDALSPANQERFDAIPLPRLVDFCWKQVSIG
jgi:hypothetical protein